MKNNKGLSYYELIIVIAIMALMVGFATISIGAVYRNDVKRVSDSFESGLKEARNKAISKGTKYGYFNFYNKDNNLYINIGEEILSFDSSTQNWVKIPGVDHLRVRTETDYGTVNLPINSGALANIKFLQSTGECRGIKFPYAGNTRYYCDDMVLYFEKKNSESEIHINKYGNITVE